MGTDALRRSRRMLAPLAAVLAALLVLAGCGGGGSDLPDGVTQSGDASTAAAGDGGGGGGSAGRLAFTRLGINTPGFGPWNQSTGNDAIVNSLLFSNLVKVRSDERTLAPDLAESWEVSRDQRTFTFRLRDDVSWSDGTPFTARDVVFTATQAAQFGPPAYVGYQPTQWRDIEGGAEIEGTSRPLRGIRALDEHTVEIRLAKPNAEYVRNLTDAVYSIVPEHLLADATAADVRRTAFATSRPVGTGPYTLTRIAPNQYYEFAANDGYFGGAPKIGTLFFKLDVKPESAVAQLESGELQLVINASPTDESRLTRVDGLRSEYVVSPAVQMLQFRTDHPQARDPRVRQAIYTAIDRRAMLRSLFGDHGEIRWVLPGFDQEDPALDRYEHDPQKARDLLAEAGFDGDAPFKIAYATDVDPLWRQMTPVIQKNLQDVGINAVLEPLDAAKWSAANVDRNPQTPVTLNSGGAMGLSPDRSSVYYNCRAPLSSFYANCDLDALYVQARGEADPERRAQLYARAAQILNRDVPQAALWQTANFHAYSDELGGTFAIFPNDRDSAFEIAGWTLG